MKVEGSDQPRYDLVALPSPDSFDGWVGQRVDAHKGTTAALYVNQDVVGAAELDDAGQWEDVPEYGHVWSPKGVDPDWQPYTAGRWIWQDPWGWSWLGDEPWGWAPYHYGRWINQASRWLWAPVLPSARSCLYSPALVAFVGASNWFTDPAGFVGWVPLGPRDPFFPWWGRRASFSSAASYTHWNRLTVVPRSAFVSGGTLRRSLVHDAAILRQVTPGSIHRGPIPIVPTRDSIRLAGGGTHGAKPPTAAFSRAVVTAKAPPSSPMRFDSKVSVIQERHGAPVTHAQASHLAGGGQRNSHPIVPIRSTGSGGKNESLHQGTTGTANHGEVRVGAGKARETTVGNPVASGSPGKAGGPTAGKPTGGRPPVAKPPITSTTAHGAGPSESVDRKRSTTVARDASPARTSSSASPSTTSRKTDGGTASGSSRTTSGTGTRVDSSPRQTSQPSRSTQPQRAAQSAPLVRVAPAASAQPHVAPAAPAQPRVVPAAPAPVRAAPVAPAPVVDTTPAPALPPITVPTTSAPAPAH